MKDIIDLYPLLKRRRVALEEWLSYHEIFSTEDFDSKAYSAAAEQDCFISLQMKEDAYDILKKKELNDLPVASDDGELETSTKKKKKNKQKENDLFAQAQELKSEESTDTSNEEKEKVEEKNEN